MPSEQNYTPTRDPTRLLKKPGWMSNLSIFFFWRWIGTLFKIFFKCFYEQKKKKTEQQQKITLSTNCIVTTCKKKFFETKYV